MIVSRLCEDDLSTVLVNPAGWTTHLERFVRNKIGALENRMVTFDGERSLLSTARFKQRGFESVNGAWPDAIVLHWLGNSSLSIEQIGRLSRLKRPIFWVLHDMWPFCGAEHYALPGLDHRFREGYTKENRPAGERGPDINLATWKRKNRSWRTPIRLIAPSNWMAAQARESRLMGRWPLTVIPYPLDIDWWGALSKNAARQILGIPPRKHVLLYGAVGGAKDPRKGADLLEASLGHLDGQLDQTGKDLSIYLFGGDGLKSAPNRLKIHGLPFLDDEALRLYYSAADAVIVPSKQDNLPQVAMEAMASGAPVIGFNVGGLPDLVTHGHSGLLVEPFSTRLLAEAIWSVVRSPSLQQKLAIGARAASQRWQPVRIAQEYLETLDCPPPPKTRR